MCSNDPHNPQPPPPFPVWMRDAQAPREGMDAFVSCEEREEEGNGSGEMNKEKKNVEYPQDHDFEKCNSIECDCDCKYCQNMHWE